jgi:hypothetical protein
VGSVYMSKSQRHKRSGAGRGVSQANGAAVHSKLPGLCQHEIVSGILEKRKQCGTVQASYGCLVGHVCMGVRVSVFAPLLCNTLVPDLDEYADGCRIQKGAEWYPFCLGGGTGRGVWGVGGPSGVSTPKSIRAFQKKVGRLLSPPSKNVVRRAHEVVKNKVRCKACAGPLGFAA